MLLWLTHLFQHNVHFLRVFNYITFRSILATLTALLFSLFFGPKLIRRLTVLQIGQHIRDDGPQSHLAKAGTPTMGGALIILAITISTLLWGSLSNHYIWIVLLVTISYGIIGWVDDYRKLVLKNSKGLSAKQKFASQFSIALLVALLLYLTASSPIETSLIIPFVKDSTIELGLFFPLFVCMVIVGASNAVNLTDGLDGLAIMPTVMVGGALGIFSYATGNTNYAEYLGIPFVQGVGELSVFCGAMVGAGLGFLWFNAYPAQIFMGDVGSLGLGAALGVIAVMVRQELVLVIMGGLFVMETMSVILQVASFKMTGKRIFKMAPLHHHFELKGWAEPKIIVRFWIITLVFVLIGLASLKLR